MRRFAALTLILAAACAPQYDVVVRGGTVYDGSGGAPVVADILINGDSIVAITPGSRARGKIVVDAAGLAVAPGFINMLSQADVDLLLDGRSQGDIRQGVTLEVMGEGESMGPLNDSMRESMVQGQGDLKYPVTWHTLGEYLETLEHQGVSTNVASFVGAATVRIHEIGYANRPPTAAELERMRALVRDAMREGAMGMSTALIYTPGFFAKTDELVALSGEVAAAGGMYISHMRSEGAGLLQAVDELIGIARAAHLPAEIFHLKAAGRDNWPKMDSVIAKVERARAEGLHITADMYTYTRSATGLDASMPPWVQEGGYSEWARRLRDPAIRARVAREMKTNPATWENAYYQVGTPDSILLLGFRNDSLKHYTGMNLGDVARLRHTTPEETAMDLVIQDGSRVEVSYASMTEDNVQKEMRQPWVSFGSDGGSKPAEGVWLRSSTHPRAYGNFARVIGRYTRDLKVLTLPEAIHKMTTLPAENLHLRRRGALRPGFYADVVVFDPDSVRDHATFQQPHQFSTGVRDVFVNGVAVLRNGAHTGAKPGRVVRGPGWTGWPAAAAR